MKKILINLNSKDEVFNFGEKIAILINNDFPNLDTILTKDKTSFENQIAHVDYIVTWQFKKEYYSEDLKAKAIFTPAAGHDWVAHDPSGKIKVTHGTFHGTLAAQSLLGSILFFNRRSHIALANQKAHIWDRSFTKGTNLLKNQRILIYGYGSIGRKCAETLKPFGPKIYGLKQSITSEFDKLGTTIITKTELPAIIKEMDHIVFLLPKNSSTNNVFGAKDFKQVKNSVYIHNLGRGNCIGESEIINALDNKLIAGAYLDVFDKEPLAETSKLWDYNNVVITPHSSCMFEEYYSEYYTELKKHLLLGASK